MEDLNSLHDAPDSEDGGILQTQVSIEEAHRTPPSIISWGRSDTSTLLRCPDESAANDMQCLNFATNRTILQIASNSYHAAAVTSTGELYTSGSNVEGQVHPTDDSAMSQVIERPRIIEEIGNHRICVVSCGLYHTVCLTASGLALSFGGNEAGQLGHSGSKLTNVKPKIVEFHTKGRGPIVIKQVACGDLFTVFLTTSGEVYCCGIGANVGIASLKNTAGVTQAEPVESLVGTNIVWVAAGSSHAIAVAATGEVYAWGDGRAGQLGIGDEVFNLEDSHVQAPQRVALPENVGTVIGAAAGQSHSLLWTSSGALLGSGSNKYGQLGSMFPRLTSFQVLPQPVVGPNAPQLNCYMAACGTNHSIVLWSTISSPENASAVELFREDFSSTNYVFGFGSNNFGQVNGSSSASMFRSPEDLTRLLLQKGIGRAIYVSAGGDQSFVIGLQAEQQETNSSYSLSLFQKQFSTQMSRAPTPMSASALLPLLQDALVATKGMSESEARQRKELSSALTTACELFSSPSLLAGSFMDSKLPMQLDASGVEAVYTTWMQLGRTAVTRLIGAIQESLSGLESSVGPSSLISESKGGKAAPAPASQSKEIHLPNAALRTLLILWQCPCHGVALLSADIFGRLLKLIVSLSEEQRKDILDIIPHVYPTHLFASRLLKPLHEHLALQVQNPTGLAPLYCEGLRWLHNLNAEHKLVPAALFYNSALSDLSDTVLLKDYVEWKTYHATIAAQKKKSATLPLPQQNPFFIATYSFLLSAEAKKRILLAESLIQQHAAQQQAAIAGLAQGFFIPFFILRVEREHLLQHTLQQIVSASDVDMRKPLRVIFENEEGIDEGGVRKEFFQLLVSQLMSVQYGMFTPTADGRSLWINQSCLWNAEEYRLVGVLLGLAVYNGVLLDVHFPKVMYKKLLRADRFELSDLASLDPALHDGLKKLLEYSPEEEVESVFCRTFEVEWEEFGARRNHELIPGGANVAVTHLNRKEYVEKLVHWLLVGSIDVQFQELYAGFSRVISPASTMTFTADELELLMVGTPHLDFNELEANTQYISGGDENWTAKNPAIVAFWKVVHELSFEDKQKLLLFSTGSNKAPIGGLKNLELKIQRMGPDSESLPTSHTCFNTLLLPEYASEDKLRDRLLTAIRECAGFGLK